ncbi:hypothetical protein [Thermogemmatispora sp.]|uniref:hypothetical protein n=1 Tax=Thermogemmatispora sp. TaxID=1968838 RepID=UPI0035E44BA8
MNPVSSPEVLAPPGQPAVLAGAKSQRNAQVTCPAIRLIVAAYQSACSWSSTLLRPFFQRSC